jgi:hypothetical protein
MRNASLGVLAVCVTLVTMTGCNDNAGPPPNDPTLQGPGSGPLAQLESSPFQNEVWQDERGQQVGILFYPRENIRVSAPCRIASGEFVCQAMQFMRNAPPVELARRSIDGRTSAGVKVCLKMNQPIVIVHNSVGSEDGFCRFPDGSMVSNAALEQYKMRVLQ